MSTMRARRWRYAVGLALVIALLIVAAAGARVWWWSPVATPGLGVYGLVPDFSLTERSGRMVTRADLVGNVSVVDFFYTRCPDSCPLQSAHLAKLQGELLAPDLRLISITVDPGFDTAAVLGAYAARFHADARRWLFLTGPRASIYALAVDGFHLAAIVSRAPTAGPAWLRPATVWAHEPDARPNVIQLVHGSRFAVVDRHARIRGYFDGTDWAAVSEMKTHLVRLLAER